MSMIWGYNVSIAWGYNVSITWIYNVCMTWGYNVSIIWGYNVRFLIAGVAENANDITNHSCSNFFPYTAFIDCRTAQVSSLSSH